MENEEVLYKNTSKLDTEEIALFQKFAVKKTFIMVSIIFSLIFVGVGVGVSFIELTFGIITIACGVLGGFVLLPYLMKENLKKQNAQSFGDKKYLNTFDFYGDYVFITSESALPNTNEYSQIASQKLFYTDVYQGVLYRDHLYLYINAQQSFIISYKGMTKGTIAEVIDFLKTKNVKIIDKSAK